MTGPWIGIDPGGRSTGIAVRNGTDLIWWAVLERTGDDDPIRGVGVASRTIEMVLAGIGTALAHAGPGAHLAVEGVVAPTPHINGKLRITDPTPAIAAAIVLGGVLAAHPGVVVVPPNRHGRGMLGGYPPELVTDAERRGGLRREAGQSATVRHARSAWDVAGVGPAHLAVLIRHRQRALVSESAGYTRRHP